MNTIIIRKNIYNNATTFYIFSIRFNLNVQISRFHVFPPRLASFPRQEAEKKFSKKNFRNDDWQISRTTFQTINDHILQKWRTSRAIC